MGAFTANLSKFSPEYYWSNLEIVVAMVIRSCDLKCVHFCTNQELFFLMCYKKMKKREEENEEIQ